VAAHWIGVGDAVENIEGKGFNLQQPIAVPGNGNLVMRMHEPDKTSKTGSSDVRGARPSGVDWMKMWTNAEQQNYCAWSLRGV